MVDLSAHMAHKSSAIRTSASGRSFAYGLVFALPVSLALWGGIAWAAAKVI